MTKIYKVIYFLPLLLLPLITVNAQTKPIVKVGGALRFNYNNSSWKDGQQERGGDFGYDFFRINA